MAEDITYYAVLGPNRPRENPSGVVRRRRLEDGTTLDDAFTRSLKWEPTEYLDRYYILGSTGREHVEITEEEADVFVRRLLKNGPNKGQR